MTATTTKHTPGPWSLGPVRDSDGHMVYQSIFGNKRRLASVTVYGRHADGSTGGRKYTDAYGTQHLARTIPEPEARANARLIAAAPELLEACEVVLASLRIDNGNSTDIHKLEVACAKAESTE